MFKSRIIVVGFVLWCNSLAFSQVLETTLEEVKVEKQRSENDLKEINIQRLTRKEITELKVNDAGELMQKFAGVSLKNYGGLGGMKTISIRGIGGSHTALVVDGFLLQNTQTAQIDLSTIPVDNLETMRLNLGGTTGHLLPISAYLSGSVLELERFDNQFSSDTLQLRFNSKVGSFGQYDSYLGVKYNRKKYFVSIFGKYRTASGSYPFSMENGNQNYTGNRLNNDLKELYTGASVGIRTSAKTLLKLSFQDTRSDQGLPGAVILYNPSAVQRLAKNRQQVNVDFRWVLKRFSIRNYLTLGQDQLTYLDSSYLNQAGYLKQKYGNRHVIHGISFIAKTKRENSFFYGGIEQNYSDLKGENSFFNLVKRYHLKSVLGWKFSQKRWDFTSQVGGEWLENQDGIQRKENQALSAYFLVDSKKSFFYLVKPSFWVKRSFRMPNFNELYYNQIGNTNLKPEIANQANLGTSGMFSVKKLDFLVKMNGYFNLIENRIVAIPTKNLFVWSMQNVGIVHAYGGDIQLNVSRKWKKSEVSIRSNYSYQAVLDFSSNSSATYKQQLPYTPRHTANFDVSYRYKKSSLVVSNLLTSDRYALNENVESNHVDGFYVMDISLFQDFKLRNESKFSLSFSIKNALNASYAFVRYYVMPGRNYLISLSFEL